MCLRGLRARSRALRSARAFLSLSLSPLHLLPSPGGPSPSHLPEARGTYPEGTSLGRGGVRGAVRQTPGGGPRRREAAAEQGGSARSRTRARRPTPASIASGPRGADFFSSFRTRARSLGFPPSLPSTTACQCARALARPLGRAGAQSALRGLGGLTVLSVESARRIPKVDAETLLPGRIAAWEPLSDDVPAPFRESGRCR